jgi:predicted ATPase
MSREPPEPLQLDYLIKAGAIHSMTGRTYRSVGVRGAEIVVVSADPDGLDDLVGGGTAVVDAGELTLLPAFADSHEHLMEASRNTLLVPVDQARSMAEFTGMVAAAAEDAAPGEWVLTSIGWHESNLAENRIPTLAELDAAAPDHPMLARRGGHFAVVNSAALGAAGIGPDTPDPPLQALAETFGDGAWLLILDNLEQVVQVAGDLSELLARCPRVAILATSRTVLGLAAEREYPVPPLPSPADPETVPLAELESSPAVALFMDRARRVRPGFALTEDNAPAVAEICRRLEGLPLAIELAAARIRLLDPAELLTRLAASLDALGTGAVDLPERQRTLRATVEWSVSLLEDAERSLLETVAVFEGGWTIEAAAQVADLDEDRALDLSEALARHSLIYLDSTGPSPRSRMLGTIRAFVAEQLAARPDVAEIQRRHAGFYQALADQAISRDDDAVRRLSQARELADRFGYHWLATSSRVQLGTLDALRGRLDEARNLLDEALDLSLAARSTSLVTLCLAAHARLAFGEGDPEQTALLEGAADGLRRRVGLRAWPMLRPTETELMTRLRQALGADGLDQTLTAGSRLNQQQAVAAIQDRSRTP